MTEGQSVTAEAARDPSAGAGHPAAQRFRATTAAKTQAVPADTTDPPAAPAASTPAAPAANAPVDPGPDAPSVPAAPTGSQDASEPSPGAPGATASGASTSGAPASGAAGPGEGPAAARVEAAPHPADAAPHPPESAGAAPQLAGGPAQSAGAGGTGGPDALPSDAPPAEPGQETATDEPEPHVRIDARMLESAILAVRMPIVAATLPLEAPGVDEARAERVKLLSQIDDYLLPRLRESGAPILVALVGSTGAGKSTLVNSIVGTQVSMTGIRRPTTNSPVLACHPDDAGWFAENVFLPTVPRVRQEGLARAGRDGLLVLAASEGMPKGVALLDTPDIDSVVEAHHDFAHQFLDASDLWLFMTTATRYADATVWELLQHARDRGASLGLVLSRIPAAAGQEVIDHFDAMLAANGLGDNERFLIPETVLVDGKLPGDLSAPIREWMADTAAQADRRVAVLTQTMSGVLDTFRARVPALAAHIEDQARLRSDLTAAVTGAYRAALDEMDKSMASGSLLRGEVLARWQDFAGTGDLLRTLQTRRSGPGKLGKTGKQRRSRTSDRAQALKTALRAAVEALIVSVADRAAEDCVSRWRDDPAGAALLGRAPVTGEAAPWSGSEFAAEAGLIFGLETASPGDGDGREEAVAGKSSPSLPTRAARAVSGWQDQVAKTVRAEHVTKRSIARAVSLGDDSLATVLMVGLLASGEEEAGIAAIPHRLLASLFGAGPLRTVLAKAKADLRDRVGLIFEEEVLRYAAIVDAAGIPDASEALQLYQATYALEMVR